MYSQESQNRRLSKSGFVCELHPTQWVSIARGAVCDDNATHMYKTIKERGRGEQISAPLYGELQAPTPGILTTHQRHKMHVYLASGITENGGQSERNCAPAREGQVRRTGPSPPPLA